ncbi:MAG: hypothetical protein J6J79_09780 [Lachnospiraceae bacterium]|nr:hypothetical protein [Lachnospiraceae bacterium]
MEKAKLEKYSNLISTGTFYLALLIELTIVILDKSAYTIQYEGIWFRLTFLLFFISMVAVKHSVREWIGFFAFLLLGFVSYRMCGKNEILRFVVFVWACHKKDVMKVLKLTFWYTFAGCVILAVLSLLGVYGTVSLTAIYRHGVEETRYCFGMGHPNAFHAMTFVLTLLGVYCYKDKIKWYGYALIFVLHLFVFFFTESRAGFLTTIGVLMLIIIFRYCKPLQTNMWVYLLGMVCIAFCVYLSVMMAKHNISHPLFEKMDYYLSGRIYSLFDTTNDEGTLRTWSLWAENGYRVFFDLGIVRIFYWYGIIPAIIYFLAQCRLLWCGYKRKDYMLLVVMVSITIYTVFEAHFVSVYLGRNYILFFFAMYLSDMLGQKEKDRICERG